MKKGIEGTDTRTVKANNIVANNPIGLFQLGDTSDKRLFISPLIIVDLRGVRIEIMDSKAVDLGKIMQETVCLKVKDQVHFVFQL